MKIHTKINGPQFPAKEGAKNHRVIVEQPSVDGHASPAMDIMTPSSQSHIVDAKWMKIPAQKCRGVRSLNIGEYNVRTLLGEDRLLELENELNAIKWDIIGLAEIRRPGENVIKLASGNILYISGTPRGGQSGVGFIVNKLIAGNITEFKCASDRVAMILVKLNSKCTLKIIQVYAPTSAHHEGSRRNV